MWLNLKRKSFEVKNYISKVFDTKTTFEAETLVWAAGVKAVILKGLDKAQFLTKNHRLKVNEFHQIVGLDDVFAIGDVAQMETEEFPNGHPMMAQPAIQQGHVPAHGAPPQAPPVLFLWRG